MTTYVSRCSKLRMANKVPICHVGLLMLEQLRIASAQQRGGSQSQNYKAIVFIICYVFPLLGGESCAIAKFRLRKCVYLCHLLGY